MNRFPMKAVFGLAVFAAVMFVNRRAEAAFITQFDGCLEGSANLVDCNGDRPGTADGDLTTTAAWSDTYLAWTVDFDAVTGNWRYTYSFFDATPTAQNLSHMLIELSDTFTRANLLSGSTCSGPEINTYSPSDPGNSNPGLPGPIYAIKCGGTQQNPVVVTILTDRAPIWGDWYAKDGNEPNPPPDHVYGYNTGFLVADPITPASSGSILDHVLIPDTTNGDDVVPSPEPASLALFGLALSAASFARRRRTNS